MNFRVFLVAAVASAVAGCAWLATDAPPRPSPVDASGPKAVAPEPPVDATKRNHVAEVPAQTPLDALAAFSVPEGFEVQLVASEPDIQKPMQLAFDEKGRLLVTCSTDYPLGAEPGARGSDKVLRLSVDGATGRASTIEILAEDLNIPSGIEALPGGRVLVAHAPDILLLSDLDGDGRPETRETLYRGFARDDTHELPNSFTWGMDGWLYALQGHVNRSDVMDRAGRLTPIHHGNVFRMRPDGMGIEVWAPGMSNPWGLAFDEKQNLFAADCESRPLWQIVQGFAYPGFNQPREPLGFAPHITEDGHGASGFAGLAYYDASAFPAEYRHCLYLGNPITNRIHRDALHGEGSTRFVYRQPDFLVSTDPWFRPVDIELGPDGALYVADWYNSVIAHVEVRLDDPRRDKTRGRIWRIVYRGTSAEHANEARRMEINRQWAGPSAHDWSQAPRKELIEALGDGQRWTRRMAAEQWNYRFAERHKALDRAFRDTHSSAIQRAEILWLQYRCGSLDEERLEMASRDPDAAVRTQAARLIDRYRRDARMEMRRAADELHPADGRFIKILWNLMADASPYVVREAVLALQHANDQASLLALADLAILNPDKDPLLNYAVTHSIRGFVSGEGGPQLALAALSQARNPDRILAGLAAASTREASETLLTLLERDAIPTQVLSNALECILRGGNIQAFDRTLFKIRHDLTADGEQSAAYARAMLNAARDHRLPVDARKRELEELVTRLLVSNDHTCRQLAFEMAAFAMIGDLQVPAIDAVLDSASPLALRRQAVIYLLSTDSRNAAAPLASVLSNPSENATVRKMVAEEWGARTKTRYDLDALLGAMEAAPFDIKLAAVQRLITQKPGVHLMLDAVESEKVSPAYLMGKLFDIYIYWAHRDDEISARFDRLTAHAPRFEDETVAAIERYAAQFAAHAPDLRAGQVTFEINCMVCHRIGGVGALLGPSLDGIGNRGLERVLQDILIPSRDLDPAFRTAIVKTLDGALETGLLASETSNHIELADAQGQVRRIRRDDIEELRREWLSPMPTGLNASMSDTEFLNLVAFVMNPPARMVRISPSR